MSDKRTRVEFIESYWKDGNTDYIWNDNHGELIRCKDCKWYRNRFDQHYCCLSAIDCPLPDDYCSRAERKNEVDNG